MQISTSKFFLVATVAFGLSACADGVPTGLYHLTDGSPDATIKIVNASGEPLQSLHLEGCKTFTKELVLVSNGVYKEPGTESWTLPADSGKCVMVQAYVNSRDAYYTENIRLTPGDTNLVIVK
jgi:hypothetical protein